VLPGLLRNDFHVGNAQQLKEPHYEVALEIIRFHYEKLGQIGISDISPHFILKLAADGIGESKYGWMESHRAIVPNSFLKTPVFKGKRDLHFLAVLCAISAAGKVFPPGLVTKPETPKAFATPQVVSDHLSIAISPYVAKSLHLISPTAPTIIPFDDHRPHFRNR
jgi:hypothetical protein